MFLCEQLRSGLTLVITLGILVVGEGNPVKRCLVRLVVSHCCSDVHGVLFGETPIVIYGIRQIGEVNLVGLRLHPLWIEVTVESREG